jgi:hypothetical protein
MYEKYLLKSISIGLSGETRKSSIVPALRSRTSESEERVIVMCCRSNTITPGIKKLVGLISVWDIAWIFETKGRMSIAGEIQV